MSRGYSRLFPSRGLPASSVFSQCLLHHSRRRQALGELSRGAQVLPDTGAIQASLFSSIFFSKNKPGDKHSILVKTVEVVSLCQFLSDPVHVLISQLLDLLCGQPKRLQV